MKTQIILSVLILTLALTACAPTVPVIEQPTPTLSPEPGPPAEPTSTAVPTLEAPAEKVPALPVESLTYADETFGLLIDFPAGWIIGEPMILGERASQTVIASPDKANQVLVTIYNWDPKNDLKAYADHRKLAWDASGFAIDSENEWVLDNGQGVMAYIVKTPEQQAFFAFAVAGDRYLEFSGNGDLALIEQIALTLRFVK